MKFNKDEIVTALRQIADLLEIADANTFEITAHRNASRSLDEWQGEIGESLNVEALTKLPAIGKGIATTILQLVDAGTAPVMEQARAAVPTGLPPLLAIHGLGPKRLRAMWQQLGVESAKDLQTAIANGRVLELKGFGAKTVERISRGLERLQNPSSYPRSSAPDFQVPPAEHGGGQLWAGTSGFSYPEWKGTFYPSDAKTEALLECYAAQLPTVEINNTFYRFPTEKVIHQWMSQTPASFRFALKAHRRITHKLRLSPECESTLIDFVARCAELESRLGCILFQFPPDFARDDQRLDFLLEKLPPGPRYAVEFRHASWRHAGVIDRLQEHNVAWVCGDAPQQESVQLATADFCYVRLRRDEYGAAELSAWDDWFATQVEQRRDLWVYLKHDEAGMSPLAVLSRWVAAAADSSAMAQQLKTALAKNTASKARKAGKTGRKKLG